LGGADEFCRSAIYFEIAGRGGKRVACQKFDKTIRYLSMKYGKVLILIFIYQ
jgi:hypothetical protein